jgi:release factor glutamine methyltransferase
MLAAQGGLCEKKPRKYRANMTSITYHILRNRLKAAGIQDPGLESRMVLRDVAGAGDGAILAGDEIPLTPAQNGQIDALLARRAAGEPLGRILGTREFWGLRFKLSPDTLEPRPDTETLIEAALGCFAGNKPRCILDIGTGTGCILISLLHEWPGTTGVATDLSAGALETARENAQINQVADRATFVQTSWAAGIEGPFDLIVSNPPYIVRDVVPNLDENVRNHDPILALDGGEDGLDAYRAILTEIKPLLSPGGIVLFEIGFDQGESVPRLVEESGATPVRVIPDSGGNPRVVECRMGISKKTLAPDS